MKVFVYSARPYDQPVLAQMGDKQQHQLHFTDKRLNLETANMARGFEGVSLFTSDDASPTVLERLQACGVRFIFLRSVGYDHVDIKKAQSLGIRVANVPEYSPYSVAEHAVALLMAFNRKIVEGQKLLQQQDFRIDTLRGFDIHGKTVGIIGAGKIGLAFARIMMGFGARVLAYDPQVNHAAGLGIEYVSLVDLLKRGDMISLHCPLNANTRHLIGSEQFALMKENAILINTSRGAIIDTHQLVVALETRIIAGACLDVYEFEKPLFFDDHRGEKIADETFLKLKAMGNVLMTCHQGFLTTDAIMEIAQTTIGNIQCFQNCARCENEL